MNNSTHGNFTEPEHQIQLFKKPHLTISNSEYHIQELKKRKLFL